MTYAESFASDGKKGQKQKNRDTQNRSKLTSEMTDSPGKACGAVTGLPEDLHAGHGVNLCRRVFSLSGHGYLVFPVIEWTLSM